MNGTAGVSGMLEDDEEFEARKHEWQVGYYCVTGITTVLPVILCCRYDVA